MNTSQIKRILKRHKLTKHVFDDVVAADRIPIQHNYPYAVVINTDQAAEPGHHWVAVYAVSELDVEYFDSYGDLPNSDIASFLKGERHHQIQY